MNTTISQKHPKGLSNLFMVEVWERFGFYAVQALLVLFLTKRYHQDDATAYDLYSAFTALIFMTPVIGGYLADKLLGFRRAIIAGGVFYIIGYFMMATLQQTLFYFGLALLICGNGFFKSCVSSLLGTLYNDNDPRRDSGFTLFYMGINIGAFLSPIICTWAADTYGWSWGYILSGIGIIIGLITFIKSFKNLGDNGLPPNPKRLREFLLPGLSIENSIYVGVVISLFVFYWLMEHARLCNILMMVIGILLFIGLIVTAFHRYEKAQRNKLIVLVVLTLFSVLFWALYMQTFSSMTLFMDRIMERHIFGYEIPTAMYQSVNPVFIMVLSPILANLWIKLSNQSKNISTPAKFSWAILLIALGFLVLPLGQLLANQQTGLVNMWWVILSYFLQTLGELLLSPIGLAMITALAPANLQGMLMGVWFLAVAMGLALGDLFANMTDVPAKLMSNMHALNAIYSHAYVWFGIVSAVVSVVLFALTPWLRRLMNEAKI